MIKRMNEQKLPRILSACSVFLPPSQYRLRFLLTWLFVALSQMPLLLSQDCPASLDAGISRSCGTCAEKYLEFRLALDAGNGREAFSIGQFLITEVERLNKPALLACLLLNTGRSAMSSADDYTSGERYLRQFLGLPKSVIKPQNRVLAHGMLAEGLRRRGLSEDAYKEYTNALSIAKAEKDTSGMAMAVYQAASIRYSAGNAREALALYLQAVELTRGKNPPGFFSALGGVTSAYSKLSVRDSALMYSRRAFEVAKTLNSPGYMGYAHLNLGDCLMLNDSLSQALFHLNKARQLFSEQEDSWSLSSANIHLGKLALAHKNYRSALDYFSEAMSIPALNGYPERKLEVYEGISNAYKNLGQYERAVVYLEKSSLLKDSLNRKQQDEKLDQLQMAYEVKEQKAQIELYQQKEKITSLTITLVSTGLAFLLLLAGAMIIAFREVRKKNRLLGAQNVQIEEQNHQLIRYTEDLERFTSVASHDLKEPARSISSFVGLILRRYSEILPEKAMESLLFIKDAAGRMTRLVEDLLELSHLEKLKGKLPTESTNSRQLLESALQNINQTITERKAVIYTNDDCQEWPALNCAPSLLSQVFQNLVANAIKFSPQQDPTVHVSYYPESDKHIFSIRDEGIGIAPEYQDQIFSMFVRLHSRKVYEGSGIGLTTCQRIVEAHGGRIWLESIPDQGSTFFFSLPMQNAEVKSNAGYTEIES